MVPTMIHSSSGYIGASAPRNSNPNRKLPDRFYAGLSNSQTSGTFRKYNVLQRMAQLSMESKDAASSNSIF